MECRLGKIPSGDGATRETPTAPHSDANQEDLVAQQVLGANIAAVRDPISFRLLSYSLDESKIRGQDFFTVLIYMSFNRLAEGLLWDWVRTHWSALVDRLVDAICWCW